MENIKNKLMENKTASIITAAIIILLIILGVLLGTGKIDFTNNKASVVDTEIQYDENGNMINVESSLVDQNSGSAGVQTSNGYAYSASGSAFFDTVFVPVLSNPDLFDYSGSKTACGDELAWVSVEIGPTRMPLNATLQAMFNRPNDHGFTPGNFVSDQTQLSFEKATIENRVAKVYLNGEFVFDENQTCDAARPFVQIEAAALQFNTVDAVQIFLNGELLR